MTNLRISKTGAGTPWIRYCQVRFKHRLNFVRQGDDVFVLSPFKGIVYY